MNQSACWCACVRAAASTLIRPPSPHRAAAAAWGEVRLRRPNDLAGADRPVVDRRCRVRAGPAAGLERAASHPPAARPARHPHPAPCPATRARHAHPPGGRAPAPAHQGARAALVLVVGPSPAHPGAGLAAYVARFSIEHTFRFFKQTLKWTTPKLRPPEAADRWTWLLLLAYVQLRLARDHVADVRLPWQRPLPPERRTPARVRRGFSQLLAQLGSPANVPKPCGRSPGRPKGKRSLPAQRFPAVKLTP